MAQLDKAEISFFVVDMNVLSTNLPLENQLVDRVLEKLQS